MPFVVGIDLSSLAVDLVRLDENTPQADWQRVELEGGNAWDRLLTIRRLMPPPEWWQDVYLVAIEEPYGRGQARTQAVLGRVVGAVVASLPNALRRPERCWLVPAWQWKSGLALKAKPTVEDVAQLGLHADSPIAQDQNARDAYCLATYARDQLADAIQQAISA